MEGENIIGLADVTGGGAISLEPGGQFELSGAPVETVHQTCTELMAHLAQVREVAKPARHRLPRPRHDAELEPRRHPGDAEGPLQDHDQLHAEGRHARPRHDVPHLHGADEPRLLLRSRHGQEAARLARAAAGRAPRCSPIRRSPKASRTASCRSARKSGATPTTRAPACCRSRSRTAWASSATSITRSTCRCISSSAATATSTCPANRSAIILAGKLILPGERATISDWANHISTIFPEVRLKRYLEMRGSDGGPWRRLPSLPAFWVGLLYDDASLDAVLGHRQGLDRRGAPEAARRRAAARLQGRRSAAAACSTRHRRSHCRKGWPPQAARSQRPRRDALSAAAAGDRRARHHAGEDAGSTAWNGRSTDLRRVRVLADGQGTPATCAGKGRRRVQAARIRLRSDAAHRHAGGRGAWRSPSRLLKT